MTPQPAAVKAFVCMASRSAFFRSFDFQNDRFAAGSSPWIGHACQKQPSTNTATRGPAKTRSGRATRPFDPKGLVDSVSETAFMKKSPDSELRAGIAPAIRPHSRRGVRAGGCNLRARRHCALNVFRNSPHESLSHIVTRRMPPVETVPDLAALREAFHDDIAREVLFIRANKTKAGTAIPVYSNADGHSEPSAVLAAGMAARMPQAEAPEIKGQAAAMSLSASCWNSSTAPSRSSQCPAP